MQRRSLSKKSKNLAKKERAQRHKQEKGGTVRMLTVMVNFMISTEDAQADSIQLLNLEQAHNVSCHMLVVFVNQYLHKVLL